MTTTRTHFAFRIDRWTADEASILDHVAGIEDLTIARAAYQAAVERAGQTIRSRYGKAHASSKAIADRRIDWPGLVPGIPAVSKGLWRCRKRFHVARETLSGALSGKPRIHPNILWTAVPIWRQRV